MEREEVRLKLLELVWSPAVMYPDEAAIRCAKKLEEYVFSSPTNDKSSAPAEASDAPRVGAEDEIVTAPTLRNEPVDKPAVAPRNARRR